MKRFFVAGLGVLASLNSVALGVEPAPSSPRMALPMPGASGGQLVIDCPVPPGLQAEKDRRWEQFLSSDPLDRRDGWYATVPVPQRFEYDAAFPVQLDLGETPILVGSLWGGVGFDDTVERRLVCGHSIEAAGWRLLVQSYGEGFAGIDLRQAIADKPLPVAEGQAEMAPHNLDFSIGERQYRYVVTGVSVGLSRVWRPDLQRLWAGMPKSTPDATDPDAIWPVLTRFDGLLLTSAPAGPTRKAGSLPVRTMAAIAPAVAARSVLIFDSGWHEQPVDLTGTPYLRIPRHPAIHSTSIRPAVP